MTQRMSVATPKRLTINIDESERRRLVEVAARRSLEENRPVSFSSVVRDLIRALPERAA